MLKKLIYISLFVSGCLFVPVQAQILETVAATDSYIEYEFTNEALGIYPPQDLMVPYANGVARYEVLSQTVVETETILSDADAVRFELSPDDHSLFEIVNPGIARGKQVASLLLHIARFGDNSTTITKRARFRVYKDQSNTVVSSSRSKPAADHPLSSGNWYKIPVSKQGVYALDTEYLEELGLNTASVDPRNIQLWGTDGYALPERNSVDRPEFSELPIMVTGENDGSFDSSDRIVFFGNSPHREFRNSFNNLFAHELHHYSDSSYVFLTVGDEAGRRLSVTNSGLTGSQTISSFNDFIWMEEELTKSENNQKSGRQWLGETIPASAENQFISIFSDTLPGIDPNQPINISGRIYLRAQQTTAFDMTINGELFHEFSIGALGYDYVETEGPSARSASFSSLLASPSVNDGILEIEMKMGNTDNGANSFVDYLRLIVPRSLTAKNNQLDFFPPAGTTSDNPVTFQMDGFSQTPMALNITDPMNPQLLEVSASGNSYQVAAVVDEDSRILAQAGYLSPHPGKAIPNQNLHGTSSYPDYIIVTAPDFLDYAQELANYRLKDNLVPLVVTQDQILNEFSAGAKDPTAIRDFIKHLYDVALADGERLPKYLLLFGDTTYDTKNIITNSFENYVLTYQSSESIDRIGSYGSDDYYGLLDDSEGNMTPSERMDIGIGRISAQTRSEAAIALDKIRRYENPDNFGEWQSLFTFAGDDDLPKPELNKDLHIENADGTIRRMDLNPVGGRSKKIYMIFYPEEITAEGRQVPGATNDFISSLNNGTLVMNYSGHGNSQVLADEELYTSDYITQLTNHDKLAVFVTATCQFGRYDDIDAQSGAEKLVFAENGGAIASFTTTRVVYTSSSPGTLNYGLNIQISQTMLERDAEGRPLTFGEIFYRTKNTRIGSESNSRKFILLGDPALRFALPDKPVSVNSINGVDLESNPDTTLNIRALDTVNLSGSVNDYDGSVLTSFNGEATLTVFDAPRTVRIPTDRVWYEDENDCYLDDGSGEPCTYQNETDIIFKGKVNVTNGTFNSTFIIPKDISFSPDQARVVVFAKSDGATAGGAFTDVVFNGVNDMAVNDGRGPSMDVFINDETFFNGSLINDSPTIIVELADSSGINTTGTGVGHEIIATIDTKPQQTFVLNDFYEGALNDYTRGRIEYPLEEIPEGSYALKVRAWDVHNNPSEKQVFFEVADQQDLVVDKVYNYPNPMNNRTAFTFEHNQQGNPLDVDIRIYTLSGKPVQHIKQTLPPTNTSSYASIPWNGRDRDNDRLGNGTYIYVLRVTADTSEGRTSTEKIEKLVIIR